MLLLTELHEQLQYLEEDHDGKKNLYVKGVFMSCLPNRNGRIYPEAVMAKEVDRYIKEMITTKRSLGELEHPPTPKINLDRVSHIIESLTIDGKNVIGKAKILDTPMGNIARGLISGGAQLGVSSRGLGSLKDVNEGLKEVQDDFHLVTAGDLVSDPSAVGAFVNGIMENVSWFYDAQKGDWRYAELAENTKKHIKTLTKRELEETRLRLLENWLQLKL